MNADLLRTLEADFRKHPVLRGVPASDAAIQQAQARLNCSFDRDYVEFLRRFGCGIVGPDPIFGIGTAVAMGDGDDVVSQTEHFRAQGWPAVENWYVISTDGRGNPLGISSDGKIRLSDHDGGETIVVAENFEAFLVQRCAG